MARVSSISLLLLALYVSQSNAFWWWYCWYGGCNWGHHHPYAYSTDSATFERVSGNCKSEIAILLDGSGSVKKENWVKMLDFVNAIAKSVPFGQDANRIGVATFGNEGTVNVPLNKHLDLASFERDVNAISFKDEKTNTADGLRNLRKLFDDARPDVAKIAIIVTDGVATMETDQTLIEAKKIRDMGAIFYGLGIGAELDLTELQTIIANSDRVFPVADFSDLMGNVNRIVFEACDAANEDPCYRKDIALVLDGSGSVGREGFELQKDFAKQLIRKIPLAADKNRVSIIVYSTEAFLKVKLGEIEKEQGLLDVIDGLQWLNQRTNTSGAARLLSRDVFSAVDVRDVSARVAVIMTDGKSNTDDYKLAQEAAKLKEMGVRVFAVGVGPKSSPYELALLSSTPTYYHTFYVKDFITLASAKTLEDVFRSVCALEMPPSAVELKPESCQSDMVFAITVSEQTTEEIFQKERELIKSVISSLGGGKCRYGLAVLGRRLLNEIPLEDFRSVEEFLSKLADINIRRDALDLSNSLLDLSSQFQYSFGSNIGRMNPLSAERMTSTYDHSKDTKFLSDLSSSSTPYDRLVGRTSGHAIKEDMDAARLLVILTDTNDRQSSRVISAAMQNLHREVPLLSVMAVGVTEEANVDVLKALASEPHSLHVMKNSLDELLSTQGVKLAQAISAVSSPVQWTCDFEKKNSEGILESNTCGFNQDSTDRMDWLLKEGETLSKKTGPLRAVNGSFYAYIEATGKRPGDNAVLISREFGGREISPICLGFYYNMYGWHIGQLEVFVRHTDGSERVHWSIQGEQGQDWHLGLVHLLMQPGMSIGFRATRADEYSGDIGIDAITVHSGACPMEKAWSAEDAEYYWALGDLPKSGQRGIRG